MVTSDAYSEWTKVSFDMSKQLAICLGVLSTSIAPDPPMLPPLDTLDAPSLNGTSPLLFMLILIHKTPTLLLGLRYC